MTSSVTCSHFTSALDNFMATVERQIELSHEAPATSWPGALHGWVTTVDHKKIGIMYILFAVVFLVIGGAEAMLMRWQLWRPRNDLIGPDFFNQMFTMHGTT